MALTVEELADLEDAIMLELPDMITEALSRTNRSGELDYLLQLLGMRHLLEASERLETYKDGKIVVIGATEVKEKTLLGVAKDLGLEKERFEFCLDYNAAKNYDFRKMQYAPNYRVILFGPVPHSGKGKGECGSIITEVEKNPAYPRVIRLESNHEIKITKTNFKEALIGLLYEEYI